jgi:hypothetical protein
MERKKLLQLYEKERRYQDSVFGDPKKNPNLNVASFLLFIKTYVDRAASEYLNKWDSEVPEWFNGSIEYSTQETAPVKTYEDLVKIMALAGAALEAFVEIEPEYWRTEGVKKKWL